MELPQLQADVLTTLADSGQPLGVQDIADRLRVDQSQVMGAVTALADAGFVEVVEQTYEEFRLGPEGEPYTAQPLPERVVTGVLQAQGGTCPLTEIPNHCELSSSDVGQSLRWLGQRGWAKKQGQELVLQADPPAAPTADEQLLQALAGERVATRAQLEQEGIAVAAALPLLTKRKGFLTVKERTARTAEITAAGRKLLAAGITGRKKVTQLTPEMLADGSWRDVELQPYDVTLAAKQRYPGKDHAFQRTMDRVRRVFLEMGFTEIASHWVEASFWDFDALFQPQDHPARDMQDTFYIARPERSQLPDDALVGRVKDTHENGGDTGSTGWQYRWNRDLAAKPVLRTHTTAATIRALHRHTAGEPGKYFIIGPVFRRETVDYKHLPVFHQVDGIIVDRHASLATLIGTLTAFYRKMGFPKVRVVPSFFPYTEPSAEVHLYLESRGEWVEMGGSGIFRPEVTLPMGVTDRVLAWGLGLERLAMMIHGLKSIGDLYFATMPWLREEPVIRA